MADLTGINPDFAQRLTSLFSAVSAQGGTLYIESGYRTTAQQAALYAKDPKMAAPPGHSNHERGLAADIHGSLDLAHRLAPLYGLTFPVAGEDWHIEPVYARNGAAVPESGKQAEAQGAPKSDPVDDAVATFMNALSGGPTPDVFGTPPDVFNPQPQTTPEPAKAETTTATDTGEKVSPAGGINKFGTALLTRLGYPVTDANLKFLAAWQRAEGGSEDNPFNTTQDAPGATKFNSVGVKRYPSVDVGLDATIKTLQNGRYGGILAALAAGNDPMASARALAASPWGTGGLVMQILGGK